MRGPLPSIWAVIVTEPDGHESIVLDFQSGVMIVGLKEAVEAMFPEVRRSLDAAGFIYSDVAVREYRRAA